ncbi:MAG: pentapeptide repeat-containing protein [Actinomycetes bacterium]
MTVRNLTVVGALSAACVLSAGVLVASPAQGQDQPGAAVVSASEPAPVTERMHTPPGSDIAITHAKLTNANRLAKATVGWNKALRVKRGQHRYNVRVVAVSKGKNPKTAVLANWSSSAVGRRTSVRLWLTAAAVRKVRAAKAVVLSVSQQYDSPRDRDRRYEKNYVSTVYLKGSPTGGSGLRTCTGVKIEPYADLSRCDLRGANLVNADLSAVNLAGANLERADLYSAKLTRADLSDATLILADLNRANLRNAELTRAKLFGANLMSVDGSGASLPYADLSGAFLTAATLVRADLAHAGLADADMNYANLSHSDLTSANLTRASLPYAVLARADLRDANFTGANLTGAGLRDAWLDGARFEGATWVGGRKCAPPSIGQCD